MKGSSYGAAIVIVLRPVDGSSRMSDCDLSALYTCAIFQLLRSGAAAAAGDESTVADFMESMAHLSSRVAYLAMLVSPIAL